MKNILFAFLFFSSSLMAQNIEVLLIGTSHDYSDNPPQDFSSIKNKIRQFKPDAFFGEFRSPEDEKVLMDHWNKTNYNKRLNKLRAAKNIAEKDLPKTIAELNAKIMANPNDWKSRMDLAIAHYLCQDICKAYFQMWQIFNNKNMPPNADMFEYAKQVTTIKMDSFKKPINPYQRSEYDNIAFPMMMEMGLKEIYPMDCQVYDLNWSAAGEVLTKQFEAFKKDSINSYTPAFRALENQISDGMKKYDEQEKSNKLTEWLNTDEAGRISASGEFMLTEMYDFPNFPKEAMLSCLHWWDMRNEGMCENTVVRARKLGIKRVVVLAGANHRQYMQAIFQKMPNVKVWNINEFGK